MIVDKHIKELALNNRRVIIPDLGAFLSKEGDGDEKNLIFSSFLKYNDGFLEKQLADKEGISQPQAAEEIKKFVEEIGKTLRAKQSYTIAGFGFFHMDERGSIAFAPQGTEIPAKPVIAENTTTDSTPVVEKESSPVVVTPPPAKPETPTVETQKVEQTTTTPPTSTSNAANTSTVSTANSANASTVRPTISQPAKPVTPPPTTTQQKQPIQVSQTPAKKSGGNGLLITIIILLVIIIAILVLYFTVPSIKDKVNSILGIKSAVEQPIDSNIPAIDTIPKTDTIKQVQQDPTAKPDKEGNITVPKTVSTYNSNYYVIVGTFQEKSNADKLYKQCIADGYDAELLPKMGPLYPVSIYNSPDKVECTRLMREAQRKYGDAWVFKSRRR